MKAPVCALALAAACFGAVVVLSLGAGLLGAVSAAQLTPPVVGGSTNGPAADSTPGGPNPIAAFAGALLAALGDQATGANVDAIVAWAAGEGSCAHNNPLDTTQPEPGAEPFNTLPGGGHVWDYPSLSVGVQATVETLTDGLYGPVLAVLRASGGPAALEAAVRATPWGTSSFGSTGYAGASCGGGG